MNDEGLLVLPFSAFPMQVQGFLLAAVEVGVWSN